MANKESPADKAKREAEEKKLAATKDTGSGDDATRITGADAAKAEKTAEDVTTDTGAEVEATGPVMTEVPEPVNNDPLTEDELHDLVGDLEPGESGWLPLDRLGRITGPARKGKPGAEELGAPVQAVVQRAPLTLTTPAGAPITRHMNPGFTAPPKPRYG